jgi:hypothetical protein
MTHEQFLNQLLRANSGSARPTLSSLNEAEAVARWMAWLAVCYLRIQHTPAGQNPPPTSVSHAWRRWAADRSEDVDLSTRTMTGSIQLKLQVTASGPDAYSFRLHDYASQLWFDASGRMHRTGGRIEIDLTRFPQTWAMVVSHRPARAGVDSVQFRPAPCCRRSLASIRRVIDSMSAVRSMLAVGQWVGLFEIIALPAGEASVGAAVEGAAGLYELQGSDWDRWAQAMASVPAVQRDSIRRIAGLEALTHEADQSRYRFWSVIAESGRFR